MNNLRKCIAIFVVLLFASVSAGCPGEERGSGESAFPDSAFGELWFNIYDSSGKIGYIHRVRSRTSYDGRNAVSFRNETYMKTSSGYDKSVSETLYSYDFLPLQEIEKDETSDSSFTMRRSGDGFAFESNSGGVSSEFSIESEDRILAQPDSLFISSVADSESIKCISAKYQKIYDLSVSFIGKEDAMCESEKIHASKYEISSGLLPDEKIVMWIDADRNECMCESAGLKIVRTDREQAESRNTAKPVDGFIRSYQKIDPEIAAASSAIKIEVSDKDKKNSFKFMKSPYLKEVYEKGKRFLVLSPAKYPLEGKCPPEAMTPSSYIQSDNAAIRAASKDLKRASELETLKAACSMVHSHISSPEHGTYLSASEAFLSKKGDCTEHAVLLAAMSRCLGMPSRVVSGILFNGYDFVLHSWAEVMCDGRWTVADAAMDRVAPGACYIALSVSYGGEVSPSDGMKLMNAVNSLRLDIRSICVKDKWFFMDKPDKFFKFDKSAVQQKLWGIRFKVPVKWKFNAVESKSLRGSRGDGLIFMAPVSDDGSDIGEAVTKLSGHKVESFYSSDMFPRTLGDGRKSLLYSSFISRDGADFTCMTYITENSGKDKRVLLVLICPQDKSNTLMSDIDLIDQSLNF